MVADAVVYNLAAVVKRQGREIAVLKRALQSMTRRVRLAEITSRAIADAVEQTAQETGVSVERILSTDRRKDAVNARWTAMGRARALGYSYPDIGRVFGVHHASVMHAVKMGPARGAALSQEAAE